MGIRFEAFVVCEKTGRMVPTGYVLQQDRIEPDQKRADAYRFECPLCKQIHTWSLDDATVRLVAR